MIKKENFLTNVLLINKVTINKPRFEQVLLEKWHQDKKTFQPRPEIKTCKTKAAAFFVVENAHVRKMSHRCSLSARPSVSVTK